MKHHQRLALVLAAAIGLAACEDDYGFHHHGPYAEGYVDGYYDDFYGPFYDGYWGPDEYFYYRSGPNGDFRRDDAHHFSRGAGNGFHSFHVHAAPPARAQSPRAG